MKVLIKYRVLLLIVICFAQAVNSQSPQPGKVRGHIYNEKNEGIQALVKIKEMSMDAAFVDVNADKDGYFELDTTADSVLLSIYYPAYKPVKMIVSGSSKVKIHMEPSPAGTGFVESELKTYFFKLKPDTSVSFSPSKELIAAFSGTIGPPRIASRIRTGFIFDKQGKPVAGASITVTETDRYEETTDSESDGSFEIFAHDDGVLTIRVEGHRPKKIKLVDFKNSTERSILIRHDGLYIVLYDQQRVNRPARTR